MRPVQQTIVMDDVPAGGADAAVQAGTPAGDCLRACVASIMEMDPAEVPHFAQYLDHPAGTDPLFWWWAVIGFASAHEWTVRYVHEAPEGWAIACGFSPRGHQHVVVVHDGRIVHDPHPSGQGLRGDPEGYFAFELRGSR